MVDLLGTVVGVGITAVVGAVVAGTRFVLVKVNDQDVRFAAHSAADEVSFTGIKDVMKEIRESQQRTNDKLDRLIERRYSPREE